MDSMHWIILGSTIIALIVFAILKFLGDYQIKKLKAQKRRFADRQYEQLRRELDHSKKEET